MSVPFMQGQLLNEDSVTLGGAADDTYAVVATWRTLRNADVPVVVLRLPDYVAPCDGYADLVMVATFKSDTANQRILLAIQDEVAAAFVSEQEFYWLPPTANNYITYKIVSEKYPIVSGTTYTFSGIYYLAGAGTLTVDRTATHTKLSASYYANP